MRPEESFDRVRQIMRKLDRSITDARSKRLDHSDKPAAGGGSLGQSSGEDDHLPDGRPRVGKARPLLRRDSDRSDLFRH